MPIYEYKARDEKDKIVSGQLEADTEADLVGKLKKMNYVVTKITEVKSKKSPSVGIGISFGRIKQRDMLKFTVKLANMLQVGLSLPSSLRILRDQIAKPKFKKVLSALYSNIASGTSFSASLSYYPKAFPNTMVRMVEVGEASGKLTETLTQYAEYAENQENIKSQIKSAMTYPIVVITIAAIVGYLFLTFVMPKFIKMFKDANIALPLPTRILMNLSNFASSYWLYIVVAVVFIVIGYKLAKRFSKFTSFIDKVKLKVPIISGLIKKMIQARFTQTLGVLYQTGVPILESLRISENIVGNACYSKALRELHSHVKDGKKISEYIGSNPLFNPEIVEMVSVGENTGRLAEMLQKSASFYYQEVNVTLKNAASLFEPLVVCVMGLCISLLACAIIMPILGMLKTIG